VGVQADSPFETDNSATVAWGRNSYRGNAGNNLGILTGSGVYSGGSATVGPNNNNLFANSTETNNGIFLCSPTGVRLRDIIDGTTKTALFSERCCGNGDNTIAEPTSDYYAVTKTGTTTLATFLSSAGLGTVNPEAQLAGSGNVKASYSGQDWVNGYFTTTRYNHVLPPNSISAGRSGAGAQQGAINFFGGAFTATSWHAAGVNTAFCDGSVQFISEEIDQLTWQYLGSRNGSELIQTGMYGP
jgi:prepilin-type processing-associated H-X9-DG protein